MRSKQSLEHLDDAGIKSIEILQSVIEDGNDSDSSISSNEESSERGASSEGARVRAFGGVLLGGGVHSLKLTWVTQVLFDTNFYAFYSVKLLRYSDLGAK